MSTGEELSDPRPLTKDDHDAIDRAIDSRRALGWLHAYGLRKENRELRAQLVEALGALALLEAPDRIAGKV